MMKQFAIIPLLFLLLAMPTLAQNVPDYTDKYVNDYANVFSAAQVSDLRNLFYDVEQQTTAEVTILTVDTVGQMDMSQYAQEIAEKWKINSAGMLIIYFKEENKIQVRVGRTLEGILPDSKIGRILDETFVLARAANDSAGGIVLAAREYADIINANADEVMAGKESSSVDVFTFFPFIFFLFFIIASIYAGYVSSHPKCVCGGRANAIRTEYETEKAKGPFGLDVTQRYAITTFKCKKCGKTFKKKMKTGQGNGGVFLVAGGFHGGGGGGFGGGGFSGGGGGFGGGGAGR